MRNWNFRQTLIDESKNSDDELGSQGPSECAEDYG